jgi:D-alanine-D-alanine ligase
MEKALVNDLFPQNSVIKVVIDRTEGGGHRDGFGPARRSTGALLCQQFGFHYAHSDAYSAAITRHKHHQAMILKTAQLPVPNTWSFDVRRGWSSGKPERGLKVICKSTFEAWSVGVSENTVGPFDEVMEDTIRILAEEIGQPVCVQEFIQGQEIYSLVLDSDVPMMVGVAEAKSSNGPKRNGSYLAFNDHHRPGGIVYNRVDGLSQECLDKISRAATKTFLLLSMSVVGRIDFRVDSLGHPYIIDIADNPGTSLSSSLVYILSEVGFTIGEIPILLLGLSLARSNIIPA